MIESTRERMMTVPKILTLITDAEQAKKAEEVLNSSHLPVQYRFHGTGTASSEVMDYLGFDGNEKMIYLALTPGHWAGRLMDRLAEKLALQKPGHGILFSMPISGISNPAMRLLDEQVRREIREKAENEVNKVTEKAKHSLILAITNRGYSEEVMQTARTAGARGGTVTNARRLGLEEAMQLWGISIQDEREIIAIVAAKEDKGAIMRAIGEHHGMKSEAHGIVLSIPVEDLMGME